MSRPAHQTTFETLNSFQLLLLLTSLNFYAGMASAQTAAQLPSNPPAQPARRIVVSLPDRKLAFLEGDRVIKIYDVAVGAPGSPSPSGDYQIVQRLKNPSYYKPGVVIGPGANNPLGPRWIGLSAKGFGIHGTNQPSSIGKNASHGCIRLGNKDMEDLFARVQVGDRVSLVSERTEETAGLFGGAPSLAVVHKTLQARNESATPEYATQGNL
jgi:hypothetical protein